MAERRSLSLPESSLSSEVINLFSCVNKEKSCVYSGELYKKCITELNNINWKELESVFASDVCSKSAEWYKVSIYNLSPAFVRVHDQAEKFSTEEDFSQKFTWIQNKETFDKCVYLLKSGENILSMQLMTSSLERILGNLYLRKEKIVPSLLKDLLSSSNLIALFGTCPMQILQLLIGPPVSLNLRNLVWHGFLGPNDLPFEFCWFLLFVISALGEILKHKNIYEENIPKRPFLNVSQTKRICNIFPLIDTQQIKNQIPTFKIIQNSMLPLWHLALKKFEEENFADCVIIVFPQLENVLRRIFALVNNCEERILTAQSSELFTTFDEIMSEHCNGIENKLRCFLGDNYTLMLLDLLSFPDGPRLRDRLSHGEVACDCIDINFANHLLCIVIYACIAASLLFDEDGIKDNFSSKLHECVKEYKSAFSPHAICVNQIGALLRSLENWNETLTREVDLIETSNKILNAVQRITLLKSCQQFLRLPEITEFVSTGAGLKILELKLSSSNHSHIYRPQTEIAIISNVTRIATATILVSEQVQRNIEIQIAKKQQHQLRSRNRQTILRMLNVVPLILSGLRIVAVILVGEFLNCVQSNYDDRKRLFQYLIQYADKLKTLTNEQKNRWDESEEVTKKFFINLSRLDINFNTT